MHATPYFETARWLRPAFAALILTTACAKPKPPTLSPKTAQVLSVGGTGVTLAVTFEVQNPNRFPLIVHAVDGRFSLGAGAGVELGQAHAEPASSIPAEGSSTVTSQVGIAGRTWLRSPRSCSRPLRCPTASTATRASAVTA